MGNGGIPLDDESLLETHASSIPPTSLRIVVRSVSVGRRPTNLSYTSLLRHSSIPSSRNEEKRGRFALYEVLSLLRLFVSYFSLRRGNHHVQFLLNSRRGFPAFSIVINDCQVRPLAESALLRTTSLAHVHATLWHTRLPWTYGSVWKIRGHACNRGPPVADRDRSVLSIVHDGSPRSKKLSLSLTFRATSIVYRTRLSSTIRFAFPSLDLSFLFFFFLRWFQWSRLEAFVEMAWICWRNICIYTVRCVKDKSIGCTRNRFKDKICIFTNLILFMRHKNSHYLFMCRRRIIFIYIFVTVYTSCMKYRAGGVSRLGLPS